MTDTDLMPFGKYKGEKMANVPASYLIWLYDDGLRDGNVRTYIEGNLDALRKEASDGE